MSYFTRLILVIPVIIGFIYLTGDANGGRFRLRVVQMPVGTNPTPDPDPDPNPNPGPGPGPGPATNQISPDAVTGLSVWLKADSLTLSDGATVSSWTDSSGNNNPGVQSSGTLQPTYQVNEINGKPVLLFDGADDYMTNSFTGTHGTIMGVVNMTTWQIYKTWLSQRGDNTANNPWPGYLLGTFSPGTQAAYRRGYASGASHLDVYSGSGTLVNDTPVIWVARYEVTGGVINIQQYINGVVQGTNQVAGSSPVPVMSFIGAGHYGASIVDYWPGEIAEIIIYNNAITTSNRQGVERYLSGKYNITVTQ